MESKDEAAVERQKLVDDGEIENDDDQTNVTATNSIAPSAPKSVQTPNSPVLSNKVSGVIPKRPNTKCSDSHYKIHYLGVSAFHHSYDFRYFRVVRRAGHRIQATVRWERRIPIRHVWSISTNGSSASKTKLKVIRVKRKNCQEVGLTGSDDSSPLVVVLVRKRCS